ncbi:hypothetical protein J2X17_000601 [Flavobacterium aquidurense]|nr:hypothetical protein [Flavobacterium aquidurense]
MFLVLLASYGLILVTFTLFINFGETSVYGVNKTVGWAYDISNQMYLNAILFPFCLILFLVGYLLLMILRRKTNYLLSITHFSLIILSITGTLVYYYAISSLLYLVSIPLFFIIIFKSYKTI